MRIKPEENESKSCAAIRCVLADLAGQVSRATAQTIHLERLDPAGTALIEANALVMLHRINAALLRCVIAPFAAAISNAKES